MNEYGKYSAEIAAICQQYGYKNCEKCPLFSACNTERQDEETQTEFTERSERALAEAYKKLYKTNTMCLNCGKFGGECRGTTETVWTGCVFKTPKI